MDGGDGYHAFDAISDISMRVEFGAFLVAFLQWNDPFGGSANDYDLFICPAGLKPVNFNLQNGVCDASTAVQNGDDDPIEEAFFSNSGEADIYIRKFSSNAKRLEMFVRGGTILEHAVPEGGIFGHPAVEDVLAVGAIDAGDPGHDDPESFSDWGPAVTISGTRNKPDVIGIDEVLVTGSGGFGRPIPGVTGNRFFGTSAAAPHVAGIAVLVMEAQRKATPDATKKTVADAVTQKLRDTAIDLGEPVRDNTFGYGRADTFTAIESIADSSDSFDTFSMTSFTDTHTELAPTSEFSTCEESVALPALTISENLAVVTEGGTATYTLSLPSATSSNTTVKLSVNDTDVATVMPSDITFTATDYSETVTVTGVADDDAENEAAVIRHLVSIGDHEFATALVPVEVTDDDAPTLNLTSTTTGVTLPSTTDVSEGYLYDGAVRMNEGETGSYTVELSSEPSGDVATDLES